MPIKESATGRLLPIKIKIELHTQLPDRPALWRGTGALPKLYCHSPLSVSHSRALSPRYCGGGGGRQQENREKGRRRHGVRRRTRPIAMAPRTTRPCYRKGGSPPFPRSGCASDARKNSQAVAAGPKGASMTSRGVAPSPTQRSFPEPVLFFLCTVGARFSPPRACASKPSDPTHMLHRASLTALHLGQVVEPDMERGGRALAPAKRSRPTTSSEARSPPAMGPWAAAAAEATA